MLVAFDDQLRQMCTTHPDDAAWVLDALTHSNEYRDREAAAIYVGHLLATRREPASRLLRDLLRDPDDRIRDKATDTVTPPSTQVPSTPSVPPRLYNA